MTPRLFVVVLAAAALTFAGCKQKPGPAKSIDTGEVPEPANIGTQLGAAAYPPAEALDSTPSPITVPFANIVILHKVRPGEPG